MKKNKPKSSRQYFDSANISESYSGIVLPLTQSFARMVYAQVYTDLLRMSGVPSDKLKKHSELFTNLLGFFYGRMYYNMNSWYLMAAFFPGYKRNKRNFELMITSNIKEDITTQIKPSLLFTLVYPLIVLCKAAVYGLTVQFFKKTVTKELRTMQDKNFNNMQYNDCINFLESINKKLLRQWYIPVENDFFVMTYLGILKKFINDQQLQKAIKFSSKSTEQVEALSFLSKKMQSSTKLWETVELNDTISFNKVLKKHPEIQSLLKDYLHLFGGRFANELKLESIGIDEDLTKLFSVLKAYRNHKHSRVPIVTEQLGLPFIKRILVHYFLDKFKKHAALREEFRLLRSNSFGMTRRLFRRMGTVLAERRFIKNSDDVFYLQIEELIDPKNLNNKKLSEIVRKRKEEFNAYKSIIPPTHFSTSDNIPPKVNQQRKRQGKILIANPSSPGIIKGKIRIFKEFSMPEKIDFDILVTSHTDPGWTSLIALSKGMIIEQGGVLSHASIVARELNIPSVIGARNAVNNLKNGQLVEIDGSTGTIKVF